MMNLPPSMLQDASDREEAKAAVARKTKEIESLLSHPEEVDLWALREMCFSEGGLMNDAIRKKAWPKLVGLSSTVPMSHPLLPPSGSGLPRHPKKSSSSSLASLSSSVRASKKSFKQPKRRPNRKANVVSSTPGTISEVGHGVSVVDPATVPPRSYKKLDMASSLDDHQIGLDIARCTWHLLNGSQRMRRKLMSNKRKKKIRALLKRKQKRLGNFINLTLIRSYGGEVFKDESDSGVGEDMEIMEKDKENKLRYYQGYHDVSCVLLSALGGEHRNSSLLSSLPSPQEHGNTKKKNNFKRKTQWEQLMEESIQTATAMGLDLPSEVLVQLSIGHFRDMMKNNFVHLTVTLKLVLLPLLKRLDVDGQVYQHLVDCDMEPYFCLSWVITWFSHDVRDTDVVKRIFDFFIASHPLMPIYVCVAMMLHPYNRAEILDADCDFACVHKALADLPKNSCSVGWKFVGNVIDSSGGYVSGEEEEDEVSFDGTSLMSQDVYREECSIAGSLNSSGRGGGMGMGDDERSTASTVPSLASESFMSGGGSSRVPFQELFDLAVSYMRRVPPRAILRLAHMHYDDETMRQFMIDADSISMFQPPPAWALASTIESDRAIKKRLRMKNGIGGRTSTINEKDTDTQGSNSASADSLHVLTQEYKYPHAVIAAGIGPDGDGEILKQRKRRKMWRISAIAVGIVAILIGLVAQSDMHLVLFRFQFVSRNGISTLGESANLTTIPAIETIAAPTNKKTDAMTKKGKDNNDPAVAAILKLPDVKKYEAQKEVILGFGDIILDSVTTSQDASDDLSESKRAKFASQPSQRVNQQSGIVDKDDSTFSGDIITDKPSPNTNLKQQHKEKRAKEPIMASLREKKILQEVNVARHLSAQVKVVEKEPPSTVPVPSLVQDSLNQMPEIIMEPKIDVAKAMAEFFGWAFVHEAKVAIAFEEGSGVALSSLAVQNKGAFTGFKTKGLLSLKQYAKSLYSGAKTHLLNEAEVVFL